MPSPLELAALSRGEIDLGLLLPPTEAGDIEAEELWCDPWAVARASNHALSTEKSIAIADLAQHDLITTQPDFGPGYHAQAMMLFASAGTTRTLWRARSAARQR